MIDTLFQISGGLVIVLENSVKLNLLCAWLCFSELAEQLVYVDTYTDKVGNNERFEIYKIRAEI